MKERSLAGSFRRDMGGLLIFRLGFSSVWSPPPTHQTSARFLRIRHQNDPLGIYSGSTDKQPGAAAQSDVCQESRNGFSTDDLLKERSVARGFCRGYLSVEASEASRISGPMRTSAFKGRWAKHLEDPAVLAS